MGMPLPDLPTVNEGRGWKFAQDYIRRNGPATVKQMLPDGARLDFQKLHMVLKTNSSIFSVVGRAPGYNGKTIAVWGLKNG